jgi:hypothetical protein
MKKFHGIYHGVNLPLVAVLVTCCAGRRVSDKAEYRYIIYYHWLSPLERCKKVDSERYRKE